MNENPNKITEMPYAKWLEQSLRDMTALSVRGIVLAAVTDDGATYTNYYDISLADKLVLSGLISQDATLDMLAANGVISYEENNEDNEGYEEDADGEEKD